MDGWVDGWMDEWMSGIFSPILLADRCKLYSTSLLSKSHLPSCLLCQILENICSEELTVTKLLGFVVVLLLNRSQHTSKATWEEDGSAGVTGQTERWASHTVGGSGTMTKVRRKPGHSSQQCHLLLVPPQWHPSFLIRPRTPTVWTEFGKFSWTCIALLIYVDPQMSVLTWAKMIAPIMAVGMQQRCTLFGHAFCSLPAVHHSLDWITWAHDIAKP